LVAGAPDGRWPLWEIEAMGLAHDGILRDAEAATNFGGGVTFRPELA
jgi:hypothetical protein